MVLLQREEGERGTAPRNGYEAKSCREYLRSR
jgi:hypothetical protein